MDMTEPMFGQYDIGMICDGELEADSKNILITSSATKVLYQIAVGTTVVLRAF